MVTPRDIFKFIEYNFSWKKKKVILNHMKATWIPSDLSNCKVTPWQPATTPFHLNTMTLISVVIDNKLQTPFIDNKLKITKDIHKMYLYHLLFWNIYKFRSFWKSFVSCGRQGSIVSLTYTEQRLVNADLIFLRVGHKKLLFISDR